jgi:hypothetical protein
MKPLEEKTREELLQDINELNHDLNELNHRLQEGRHYLMGIQASELTVEDALEAFGFGRDGLQE